MIIIQYENKIQNPKIQADPDSSNASSENKPTILTDEIIEKLAYIESLGFIIYVVDSKRPSDFFGFDIYSRQVSSSVY